MRVQPVGLLRVDEQTRVGIAQFQAALTHGHPTALAAADLTAATISFLVAGCEPRDLPGELRGYAQGQRATYHAAWLGSLWHRPGVKTDERFIRRGWDEVLGALDRLDRELERPDGGADPCIATGAGWVAQEAPATALLCFVQHADDPVAVIRRAAVTSGDSDSIACLAGAFAGAYHGLDAWPAGWVERIEYRDRLKALAKAWD
jgi:ADP-ribosylglycohydrolase